MKYGIKLTPTKFIYSCDNNWYESCDYDHRPYTFEEALYAIQLLKKHFQYHVVLVSDDGEEVYEFGKKVNLYNEVEKMIGNKSPVSFPVNDSDYVIPLF